MSNKRKPGALIQGYFSPIPSFRKPPAEGLYKTVDGDLHKRCSRCTDYWPADTEFFFPMVGKASGLHGYCRACYEEKRGPRFVNGERVW